MMFISWEVLSPNQQRVMTSAMELQNLAQVRMDWQANVDRVLKWFKNTMGPDGLIETKWLQGGP